VAADPLALGWKIGGRYRLLSGKPVIQTACPPSQFWSLHRSQSGEGSIPVPLPPPADPDAQEGLAPGSIENTALLLGFARWRIWRTAPARPSQGLENAFFSKASYHGPWYGFQNTRRIRDFRQSHFESFSDQPSVPLPEFTRPASGLLAPRGRKRRAFANLSSISDPIDRAGSSCWRSPSASQTSLRLRSCIRHLRRSHSNRP
jgi:hypothetical protein